MKCFYHRSDLDGHCSGAIVKMKHPECETIGVNYGDSLVELTKKYKFITGETIFVVDFSFSKEDMAGLQFNNDLIWIDHHKSAIEKCSDIKNIKGLRHLEIDGDLPEDKLSGCDLTWKYLYPLELPPPAVYLLGRYDVWDHEHADILPFQYGMKAFENTHPDSDIWFEDSEECILFKTPAGLNNIIQKGKTIIEYQEKLDKSFAKGMAFELSFNGWRAIAANKPYSNSKVFDSVYDESKHDIMIIFGYKPHSFKYSLYSTKDEVDCSEIAKRYGGGGHKGAAGFEIDILLF